MARIRTSEPLVKLLRTVPSETWSALVLKYKATDTQGRYFHWNDFQWRVESGDDQLAAWTATKLSRHSTIKRLPLLKAEVGVSFSYCIPDSLFAQLHKIDKITGSRSEIDNEFFTSTKERDRYLVKSLIQEEAITSSQLEGASTTRKIAEEMLEKDLAPNDKSQQMILNNYRLMKEVTARRNDDLSIEFILELHRIATEGAIENQAIPGELRTYDNISVSDMYGENSFQPPAHDSLKTRLEDLCTFANDNHVHPTDFIHPIVKAIILHFMISYIHPFGDGNGRTARAIFYWSILRSGYWLFEYVSISKFIQAKRGDYDKAFIYTETDEFDLTYFIYNQVEVIEKAVLALYEYTDRKKREYYDFMGWVESSSVAKSLKRIHLEILKKALKEPGREFTTKQIAADFDITENTARSHLNKLVEKNLLVASKSKKGKATLYISPANLKTRLKL